MTIEVLDPGVETTVQDYPGRMGYSALGIPPSGPFDDRSFRLGNALVCNSQDAAGLEMQYTGPTLRFVQDATVAIAGATFAPVVDGKPVPMWQTVRVRAGQILDIGRAVCGVRGYLLFAGGLNTTRVLGSRSTFVRAGIGGIDGRALVEGDQIDVLATPVRPVEHHMLHPAHWPAYGGTVTLEVTAGPHDDWLDDGGREALLDGSWTVTAQSDRTGYRLEGPPLTYAERAYVKPAENGSSPTNIVNTGYPVGGINLAGASPIILPVDGPSQGGFITPYTVVSSALWKLAQAKAGDRVLFREVSISDARRLRIRHQDLCNWPRLVRLDRLSDC